MCQWGRERYSASWRMITKAASTLLGTSMIPDRSMWRRRSGPPGFAPVITDADIATAWYSYNTREELVDSAANEGRPFLARGEFPPRLYHRTTHDAAFLQSNNTRAIMGALVQKWCTHNEIYPGDWFSTQSPGPRDLNPKP